MFYCLVTLYSLKFLGLYSQCYILLCLAEYFSEIYVEEHGDKIQFWHNSRSIFFSPGSVSFYWGCFIPTKIFLIIRSLSSMLIFFRISVSISVSASLWTHYSIHLYTAERGLGTKRSWEKKICFLEYSFERRFTPCFRYCTQIVDLVKYVGYSCNVSSSYFNFFFKCVNVTCSAIM